LLGYNAHIERFNDNWKEDRLGWGSGVLLLIVSLPKWNSRSRGGVVRLTISYRLLPTREYFRQSWCFPFCIVHHHDMLRFLMLYNPPCPRVLSVTLPAPVDWSSDLLFICMCRLIVPGFRHPKLGGKEARKGGGVRQLGGTSLNEEVILRKCVSLRG